MNGRIDYSNLQNITKQLKSSITKKYETFEKMRFQSPSRRLPWSEITFAILSVLFEEFRARREQSEKQL